MRYIRCFSFWLVGISLGFFTGCGDSSSSGMDTSQEGGASPDSTIPPDTKQEESTFRLYTLSPAGLGHISLQLQSEEAVKLGPVTPVDGLPFNPTAMISTGPSVVVAGGTDPKKALALVEAGKIVKIWSALYGVPLAVAGSILEGGEVGVVTVEEKNSQLYALVYSLADFKLLGGAPAPLLDQAGKPMQKVTDVQVSPDGKSFFATGPVQSIVRCEVVSAKLQCSQGVPLGEEPKKLAVLSPTTGVCLTPSAAVPFHVNDKKEISVGMISPYADNKEVIPGERDCLIILSNRIIYATMEQDPTTQATSLKEQGAFLPKDAWHVPTDLVQSLTILGYRHIIAMISVQDDTKQNQVFVLIEVKDSLVPSHMIVPDVTKIVFTMPRSGS